MSAAFIKTINYTRLTFDQHDIDQSRNINLARLLLQQKVIIDFKEVAVLLYIVYVITPQLNPYTLNTFFCLWNWQTDQLVNETLIQWRRDITK